jgi:rhodanese-related sulfurtransferase
MFAWGVQVVQGIDKYAATRNARVVLVDNQMVRALMTASWMVQQGWPDTFVLADPFAGVALETGEHAVAVPGVGEVKLLRITPAKLNELLQARKTVVIDVADSLAYKKGHIPGAWFAIRSQLAEAIKAIPKGESFVVTGDDPDLMALTARDLAKVSGGRPVSILAGGNAAWRKANLPVKAGFENLATPADDIFRQPFLWGHFEPMSPEFKQAALDYFKWELQLPEQLERAAETKFYRLPEASPKGEAAK